MGAGTDDGHQNTASVMCLGAIWESFIPSGKPILFRHGIRTSIKSHGSIVADVLSHCSRSRVEHDQLLQTRLCAVAAGSDGGLWMQLHLVVLFTLLSYCSCHCSIWGLRQCNQSHLTGDQVVRMFGRESHKTAKPY